MLEKFTKRRYTPNVGLLYILAEAGLPTLIRAHSERQSCFQIEGERYGVPILAASSMKHGPTMEVMLELEAGRIPTFDFQELSRRFPLRLDDLDGTSLNFGFKQGQDLIEQLLEHGSDFVSLFYLMVQAHHAELLDWTKGFLLRSAFRHCRTDVVKFLLGCGSLIPKTYPDCQTPLHYASSGGCAELAKLLLDYGSEIMATNHHGKTPLHLASSADVAKLLILCGSNIEASSTSGGTPLHDASGAGRVAVAQVLVDSGACVSVHNQFTGSTPLHTAAQHRSIPMMRFLIDNGASVSSTDNNGDTPLHGVGLRNKSAAAIANWLIEKGASISAINNNGDTALHIMCRLSLYIMATVLIENGASVSVCNGKGETPLHMVVKYGSNSDEFVELLIKSGASVLAADHDGDTLLHLLGSYSSRVAQILIDNGDNVLATNKAGKTPFHSVAPRDNDATVVKHLVRNGANTMAVDDDGRTVLLELLMSERHSSSDYYRDTAEFLIDTSVSVCVADKDGNTPLLVASSRGLAEIVRLLLYRDVDVSAANKDGKTPLLAALSNGHDEIVRMLRARISTESCPPSNNEAIL